MFMITSLSLHSDDKERTVIVMKSLIYRFRYDPNRILIYVYMKLLHLFLPWVSANILLQINFSHYIWSIT